MRSPRQRKWKNDAWGSSRCYRQLVQATEKINIVDEGNSVFGIVIIGRHCHRADMRRARTVATILARSITNAVPEKLHRIGVPAWLLLSLASPA